MVPAVVNVLNRIKHNDKVVNEKLRSDAKEEMKDKARPSDSDDDDEDFETESEHTDDDDDDDSDSEDLKEDAELGFVSNAPGLIDFDCILTTVDYPRKGQNPSSVFTGSLRQLSQEHP